MGVVFGDPALRAEFLLDPGVAFLNHGSFGATPRAVIAERRRLEERFEHEPVAFVTRQLAGLYGEARERLAREVGAEPRDLVFVENATTGLNIVLRSLPLGSGDEVLASDHEYGALLRAWEAVCRRRGARLRRVALPDAPSAGDWLGAYREAISPRTRVLFVSHVSSPTALRAPIDELVALGRERGLWTVVDGAHGPGQLALELGALGADAYVGNAHKWLLCAKGCAFLHVRRERQAQIEPLVVSWGATNRPPGPSVFLDELEWSGTRDPSAWLALPAALDFREAWSWPQVAAACRRELAALRQRLAGRGLRPLAPQETSLQMAAFVLPPVDEEAFHDRLEIEYGVQLPVHRFRELSLLRVSLQGYNGPGDLARLEAALEDLLPGGTPRVGLERPAP
jgi:isopenicillin-N epimerase